MDLLVKWFAAFGLVTAGVIVVTAIISAILSSLSDDPDTQDLSLGLLPIFLFALLGGGLALSIVNYRDTSDKVLLYGPFLGTCAGVIATGLAIRRLNTVFGGTAAEIGGRIAGVTAGISVSGTIGWIAAGPRGTIIAVVGGAIPSVMASYFAGKVIDRTSTGTLSDVATMVKGIIGGLIAGVVNGLAVGLFIAWSIAELRARGHFTFIGMAAILLFSQMVGAAVSGWVLSGVAAIVSECFVATVLATRRALLTATMRLMKARDIKRSERRPNQRFPPE